VKVKVEKVEVKLEDAGVKMEHGHADDGDGCDAFQYMSQECCASADLPAKPSKKTKKVSSCYIQTLLTSVSWPPALFHTTAARAFCGARHNTCVY
jgi:hypothetical protein